MAAAPNRERKWDQKELPGAVTAVCEGRMSLREAEARYGIPKSTLGDYVSGRREIGSTRGPQTILTADEEKKLADWALEMALIGYGRTKEQILLTVQKIMEADKRPNPFTGHRPGNKWWSGFLKRHPNLATRKPENLEAYRAAACTKERLGQWYSDFQQFLLLHNIGDDPRNFWNADESGFALSPKPGKVVSARKARDLYAVTGYSKEQITTLCAGSASGEMIPPMHIFAGQRFSYNPLEGAVPGAYFGKSQSGWIDTELFYGWIANHFARQVKTRPVVLLVDGHKSHINVETAKFCKDNDIHLYCLPPHSSHITQPLDVGFFKGLKDSWKKSCQQYIVTHPGHFVTKQVFASIFKEAWLQAVQPIKLVNAFRAAGIYPLDFSCVPERWLAPSRVYTGTHADAVECKSLSRPSKCHSASALAELESVLSKETLELYQTRCEEGYDLETDTVYSVWKKLKDAQLCKLNPVSKEVLPLFSKSEDSQATVPAVSIQVTPGRATVTVESVLDTILVYPRKAAAEGKKGKSSEMPRHLSSHQMIAILEAKEREKQEEEDKKAKLKAEREEKRKKRQEEKEKKLMEKAKKWQEREKCMAKKKTPRTGRVKADIPVQIDTGEADEGVCATCGTDEEGTWICCDSCSKWHHLCCVGLSDSSNLVQSFWKCAEC